MKPKLSRRFSGVLFALVAAGVLSACGAIVGSGNGKVGAGSGPSRAEAESAALAQCARNGGTACALSPALPAQCI